MVGLINLGAGLSAMGGALASSSLEAEKNALDVQKMQLADQLQGRRELANIAATGVNERANTALEGQNQLNTVAATGSQQRQTQEAANKLPMTEAERAQHEVGMGQVRAAQTSAGAAVMEAEKPVPGGFTGSFMVRDPSTPGGWKMATVGGPDIVSGNADLHGQAFLDKVPTAARNIVKMIGNGDMAPLSGTSLSRMVAPGVTGGQVMDWVNQYNEKFSGTDMHTMQTARTAFINGQDGKTVTAFNAVADHIATAEPMFDALKNGNVQLFNQAANAWARATGNPVPTNAKMAATLVGDELAKAVIGNGGGEADRRQMQDMFSGANSPEQIAGAFQTAKEFAAGKLRAEEKKYTANTRRNDFSDQLLPNAQYILQGNPARDLAGQGGGGTRYPAPPPAAITDLKMRGRGAASQFDQIFGPGAADKILGAGK